VERHPCFPLSSPPAVRSSSPFSPRSSARSNSPTLPDNTAQSTAFSGSDGTLGTILVCASGANQTPLCRLPKCGTLPGGGPRLHGPFSVLVDTTLTTPHILILFFFHILFLSKWALWHRFTPLIYLYAHQTHIQQYNPTPLPKTSSPKSPSTLPPFYSPSPHL